LIASGHGRLSLDELKSLVAAGEIDTVLLAICDMQGRLQGKRVDAEFFLDDVADGIAEGCSYLLATDVEMATVGGFELTSWAKGYQDVVFRPDLSTLRRVPWHDATVFVMADVTGDDDEPVAIAPRQLLQAQEARLKQHGWTALAGTELEFIVFNDTYEHAWRTGYRELSPANLYNVDYSLQGTARVEPLLQRIRRSMRGAGMVVESAKGECNFGQHEIAFRYDEIVAKCDEHSLFKLGAKEIAAQEGCSLTFMAKFDQREGNSCHIHLSLRDEADTPVFPDAGSHAMSEVFQHFLAGALASARELSFFFAPNVNSYKRFAPGSFAPTALLWGVDNRTCAFRIVGHGPALRFECRIPGGDVNPYLAIAALIAGGLHGIDNDLPLGPAFVGNAYEAQAHRMPTSLAEAVELFDQSAIARGAFGDDVVEHYVNAARVEVASFNAAVTDWERFRGFERL
jgi:glutamine synthetase